MTIRELYETYPMEINFFVDELTDNQIKQLWKDCEKAGLQFNATKQINQFGNTYTVHSFEPK